MLLGALLDVGLDLDTVIANLSSLKVNGDTWNPVDPKRAAEFMRLARAARDG